jgi:hypothetical protein
MGKFFLLRFDLRTNRSVRPSSHVGRSLDFIGEPQFSAPIPQFRGKDNFLGELSFGHGTVAQRLSRTDCGSSRKSFSRVGILLAISPFLCTLAWNESGLNSYLPSVMLNSLHQAPVIFVVLPSSSATLLLSVRHFDPTSWQPLSPLRRLLTTQRRRQMIVSDLHSRLARTSAMSGMARDTAKVS